MDTTYSNCRNILSIFIKVSQLCNFLKQCLFCGNPTYRFCTIKSKNITCLHCFYIQIFNRTIAETYINIVIQKLPFSSCILPPLLSLQFPHILIFLAISF